MTSPAIDPELLPFLNSFPTRALSPGTVSDIRAELRTQQSLTPPFASRAVKRSEVRVPGAAGDPPVRALVYSPAGQQFPRPAYLHIHGGGYVVGTPEMNESRHLSMVEALGIVVVSVDYRLAPEHRHPAALQDCHAVLRWLAHEGGSIGVDPQRIAIGGESAGAGLAANLALLARDQATAAIALQALMYPMLDDRTGSIVPPAPNTSALIWPAASNVFGWSALLGHAPTMDAPPLYAAAARADRLDGVAPLFMAVAALDILRDENIEYAKRLMQAGVTTEMHVYPGTVHAFDLAPDTAPAQRMIRDLHDALRRALGVP